MASIDIISLGAGVQSSFLLMAADRGEIKINGEVVIPQYAIISDPGNEPRHVYEWLTFLQSQVKNIQIICTDNGNIVTDTLNGIKHNTRFASVPFFTKSVVPVFKQILVGTQKVWDETNEEFIELPIYKQGEQLGTRKEQGVLWRQCTQEYKINAVRKEIRRILGVGPRDRVKDKVRLWMGISTDEIQRVKPSGVQYIENYFPLIEDNLSRNDCLQWFARNQLPLPPRSSCIICPYHSNEYWRNMKTNDPESWQMAVEFDKSIRHMPKLNAEVYLHRRLMPLDEVDLGADQLEMDFDLFDNECEGMCGV